VCVCVCAFVRACVRACVRARACVCAPGLHYCVSVDRASHEASLWPFTTVRINSVALPEFIFPNAVNHINFMV